ncbi:MAG: hypothetical protein MUC61_03755 [Amoebophilaceae bacterium]|nr:hypothetical protein [Amoebophilaceae bacterium]
MQAIQKLGYHPYISGIIYILGAGERHNAEALLQSTVSIIPERKEDIMNAAQQLRQQGMQREKLHLARNMLYKLHLGIQTVA